MRNVKRTSIPPSLQKNAKAWTTALLKEIAAAKRAHRKVESSFFDKYRKEDVRDALQTMYKDLCCYCEATISVVSYPNIEHRIPKAKKPKLTFDWDNLHLACPRCNTTKSDEYTPDCEVLDSVTDVPISDHLYYELLGVGMWCLAKTPRGDETIRCTDLNRVGLINARLEVYLAAMKVIHLMNRSPLKATNATRLQQLKEMSHGEYGSVIEHAMELL